MRSLRIKHKNLMTLHQVFFMQSNKATATLILCEELYCRKKLFL